MGEGGPGPAGEGEREREHGGRAGGLCVRVSSNGIVWRCLSVLGGGGGLEGEGRTVCVQRV